MFDVMPYKGTGTSILKSPDEASQLLDDHIVMTQSMSFSPYKKQFEERINTWENKLRLTQVHCPRGAGGVQIGACIGETVCLFGPLCKECQKIFLLFTSYLLIKPFCCLCSVLTLCKCCFSLQSNKMAGGVLQWCYCGDSSSLFPPADRMFWRSG